MRFSPPSPELLSSTDISGWIFLKLIIPSPFDASSSFVAIWSIFCVRRCLGTFGSGTMLVIPRTAVATDEVKTWLAEPRKFGEMRTLLSFETWSVYVIILLITCLRLWLPETLLDFCDLIGEKLSSKIGSFVVLFGLAPLEIESVAFCCSSVDYIFEIIVS